MRIKKYQATPKFLFWELKEFGLFDDKNYKKLKSESTLFTCHFYSSITLP